MSKGTLYLDTNLADAFHRILKGFESIDNDLTAMAREGNPHVGEMTLRLHIDYTGGQVFIVRMEDDWAVLEEVRDD